MADGLGAARIAAQVLANSVNSKMAGILSNKFDLFAMWMLAGFGAAGALLVANQSSGFVGRTSAHSAIVWFFLAVVITVAEKYLAAIISAGSEATEAANAHVKEQFNGTLTVDPPTFFNTFVEEIQRPVFCGARWWIRRTVKKVASGDLTAGSRPLVVMVQIQGALLFAQVCSLLRVLWIVAKAIPG